MFFLYIFSRRFPFLPGTCILPGTCNTEISLWFTAFYLNNKYIFNDKQSDHKSNVHLVFFLFKVLLNEGKTSKYVKRNKCFYIDSNVVYKFGPTIRCFIFECWFIFQHHFGEWHNT